MSDPNRFMSSYTVQITGLVQQIQILRGLNDMLVQDPTIVDRYFTITNSGTGTNAGGQTPRNDINAADVNAAKAALDQVIFAYDSGNPTQKSHIYKMLAD